MGESKDTEDKLVGVKVPSEPSNPSLSIGQFGPQRTPEKQLARLDRRWGEVGVVRAVGVKSTGNLCT